MKKNSREKKDKKIKDLILSPGDYGGEIPVRQDITILPANDPHSLRLGWTVYEFIDERDYQRFIKKNGGKKALKEYLHNNHPDRLKETDLSDICRKNSFNYVKPDITRFGTLNVLPELYGKPFNNGAMNLIHALRPSAVRVTTGEVTLDAHTWRVTVLLKDDNITIDRIYQEVELGGIGTGEYEEK